MEIARGLIRKFVKLITPPPIGGLFVGTFAIHYLELKDALKGVRGALGPNDINREGFLRLPPGILEGAKVVDKINFVSALKEVHRQISGDQHEVVNIVLTLPAREVFVQTFNLPKLAERSLAEAAELNSRMISPIPVTEAYSSWQKVGETATGGGQIEVLGAFVSKDLVDELIRDLREAGFGVAAVEFSSLSLTRSLNSSGLIDSPESYLVIEVGSYGLDLMIIRNKNIYFDYTYSWDSMRGEAREITLPDLKKVFEEQVQKLMNFHSSRFGGQIKKMIMVAPAMNEDLNKIATELFPGTELRIVGTEALNPVLGAALRGLIPRVKDFDISLTSLSVTENFLQEQVMGFASLWRSVLLTVAGFLLLIFMGSDVFLRKAISDAKEPAIIGLKAQEQTELEGLRKKVDEFNKAVNFVKFAKEKDKNISPVLQALDDAAGTRVRLDRVYLPGINLFGSIIGETDSNEAVVDFKNKVARLPQFAGVDLPLGSVINQADGRVSFTLNLKVQSLDF